MPRLFYLGAKNSGVRCLSPTFCSSLYRLPCDPRAKPTPREPCGPCIYGYYLELKSGQEICFPGRHPQIHKEAPGDDPEFSAVPEAQSQSLTKQQKDRVKDVNGALDFLADFAAFQQQQQQEEEEEPQVVEARADQSIYARLAKLRRQQAEAEEELEEANDDLGPADDEEDPEEQFSDSYVQSLLGRFQQQQPRNNKMESKVLETTTILTTKAPRVAALQQNQQQNIAAKSAGSIDFVMIALLTCLAVAAALGVIVSIFCFVKIQKRSRSTQRFDYSGPGNGSGKAVGSGSHDSLNGSAASAAASKLTAIFGGSSSASNVDKKLANNATLYHFEHHKKEMMAAESGDVPAEFGDSDAESGDDNDDNDYTVYECPGLAPTGEMQVDNPLFRIKQQASQPAGGPATARVSPPVVVHGLQQSASPK